MPEVETPPVDEEHPAAEAVRREFPAAVQEVVAFRGDTTIVVDPERVPEVAAFLRDHPDFAFNYLADIVGIDYLEMDREPRYGVVYNLYSIGRWHRLFLKALVDEDEPELPSVVEVWPNADWHEREVYDMFGIHFRGHPDLRRILMADDWLGHPQRKDYPLGGEEVQFSDGKFGPSIGPTR